MIRRTEGLKSLLKVSIEQLHLKNKIENVKTMHKNRTPLRSCESRIV